MKNLLNITIKLEEAAMALAGICYLFLHNLGLPFWVWFLLFFSPDISMLGYLASTRTGAFFYNLFHHKGLALVLMAVGYFIHADVLMAIGVLLFAHSSFDRAMGYGLKYADDFKHTHLGWLPYQKAKAETV